jgi:hypothetical protein
MGRSIQLGLKESSRFPSKTKIANRTLAFVANIFEYSGNPGSLKDEIGRKSQPTRNAAIAARRGGSHAKSARTTTGHENKKMGTVIFTV